MTRTDGTMCRFHPALKNNKVEFAAVELPIQPPCNPPPAKGKGKSDGRGTYRRKTAANYDGTARNPQNNHGGGGETSSSHDNHGGGCADGGWDGWLAAGDAASAQDQPPAPLGADPWGSYRPPGSAHELTPGWHQNNEWQPRRQDDSWHGWEGWQDDSWHGWRDWGPARASGGWWQ